MQKLLVLGAGNLQIPLIEKAKSKGIYTIAVDINANAPGKHYANEFYSIDTNNSLQLLELAREQKINGVITNSDYPMRSVSKIAAELGLPGMNMTSALIATNKLLLREVLQENGVVCPRFAKVARLEDIYYQASYIQFPFILKPVDSSASRGVHLVESPEQIEQAYIQSSQHSRNGYLIMEQYISGREFSVESVTLNGITQVVAVTAKITSGAPHFVELGHIIKADIHTDTQIEIENLVCRAIQAIGITNGVSHTELKTNPEGIFIIEVGPRLGGDYITADLVPLATGYDIVGNAINIAMGIPLEHKEQEQKYAGIGYFIAPEGELKQIIGLELLDSSSRIHRHELFIKPGDAIRPLMSSLDRAGYVIVFANSYNECVSELKVLQSAVHFLV